MVVLSEALGPHRLSYVVLTSSEKLLDHVFAVKSEKGNWAKKRKINYLLLAEYLVLLLLWPMPACRFPEPSE